MFLSGPGKFSFYNKNTGAILLEKEFNLQPKKRDTLYIFQPDCWNRGDLDTASYYLIKKPIRAGLIQTQYKFSFLDHETKTPIQSSNGAVYLSLGLIIPHNPTNPGKQVYTVYLADTFRAADSAAYILKSGKYYDVSVTKLFE